MRFVFALVAGCLATLSAGAFQPIPTESAKALGVTRGKPFSSGAVFVNGKYLEPPYVVERWGTGIRINGNFVSGQIINWNEFVKTQTGARVTKQEIPAPDPVVPIAVPAEEPSPAPVADVDATSLDDLFDDDPKPQPKPAAPAVVRKPVVAKPTTVVTYSLDGGFVPNEASKALLRRINSLRTDIDRTLRSGGFICFGDSYSQVTGDARTLLEMLESLPELMQNAFDTQDFCRRVRAERMVYLNEVLSEDLYRNRMDYRKLKNLRTKLKKENELNLMLKKAANPLF